MSHTRRIFGVELRLRRMAAGMSLTELANLTFYTKGHLSKVETGKRLPTSALAAMADTILNADGALVSLAKETSQGGCGDVDANKLSINGFSPSASLGDIEVQDANATALLANIDLPPTAVPVSAIHGESIALAFDRCLARVRNLGQQVSPGAMLPVLVGYLRSLRDLLNDATGADRAPLLISAAHFAEYAGWMAQESGDENGALMWTDRAVQLANAADHTTMASYAVVRQALITLYRGDGLRTINLARKAQADKDVPFRVRGLAALREGQGYAICGNHSEFRRAMDRAETLLDRQSTDRCSLAFGTSTVINPARMATGWSMYHVGRPAEGASILEDEISRIPADAHRAYSRYASRCALQHAVSGEVDRACEITTALLPRIADLSSATIALDLNALTQTLGRWRKREPIRTLLPELNRVLYQAPLSIS